jgi:membrane-bound lytic murein transglycosylase B
MHGELGQTQFMPKNVLMYGVGNLNSKEGALASTAKFLVGHGWQRGKGYQRGQPNYGAIQGWNAATVYQQAIAIMGKQIDGLITALAPSGPGVCLDHESLDAIFSLTGCWPMDFSIFFPPTC